MGDLGGLLDVIMVIGSLTTSIFASKLFTADLIGHTYRIQEYMKDTSQFYKTTELYKLTEENDAAKNVNEQELGASESSDGDSDSLSNRRKTVAASATQKKIKFHRTKTAEYKNQPNLSYKDPLEK